MTDFIVQQGVDGSSARITVGHSDAQQIQSLVRFCKGWHRFSPFIGACLEGQIGEISNGGELYGKLRHELAHDGVFIEDIRIKENGDDSYGLEVDAHYVS